jgi:hypothetical protein
VPTTVSVPAGSVWHGSVPAPPSADGRGLCIFEMASASGGLRVSQVRFKPGILHRQGVLVPATATPTERTAYCLSGRFVDLYRDQPSWDARYLGATPAFFVEGKGLTCDEPAEGLKRRGWAGRRQHVSPGIYPYFTP